ncbi:MAG: hypothetical protein ACKO85_07500 [Isosphaeraceae bacterium]
MVGFTHPTWLKKWNDILMGKESIPKAVKTQVEEIVTEFNKKWFRGSKHCYLVRFRGRFAYLDRFEYEELRPICRVEFGGKIDNWDFAIYKYSSGRYDPEEFLFPGSDCVDGTIEGAMKAGLEAYPP